MATRTKNQNTLALGDWNAICDVCGFKFKASDLKKRWDGYMVCEDDWERRHESDFFRAPVDNQSVPWNRVDNTPDPSSYTDVAGNSVSTDTAPDETTFGRVATTFWETHSPIQIMRPGATESASLSFDNTDPNVKSGDRFIIYCLNTVSSGKVLYITSKNPLIDLVNISGPTPPRLVIIEYNGNTWEVITSEPLSL